MKDSESDDPVPHYPVTMLLVKPEKSGILSHGNGLGASADAWQIMLNTNSM
jgi:hypothetical protein